MAQNPLHRFNYFFCVLMREKSALINTVFLILFGSAFAYMTKGNRFLLNLIWCIFAVNTPATTMFSGDKALLPHEKMLPRHSQLLSCVYGLFLTTYYSVTNAYGDVLFTVLGQCDMSVLRNAIVLVPLETCIALLLERRFPIRSWQTKQKLWRNACKYVIPIIIFAVSTPPRLLATLFES